ncbi:hypothetical protein BH09MYX1_BH09MYX1_35750 [soil metagenome]
MNAWGPSTRQLRERIRNARAVGAAACILHAYRMHCYVTGDLARAAAVAAAVASEDIFVQLRAPLDHDVSEPLARELRAITARAGARFIVNRRLALARAVCADGLHVAPNDVARVREEWPGAWISAPCHDDGDVTVAIAAGADAIFVSPIFSTPGKGRARGGEALASARALGSAAGRVVSILALGGITLDRVRSCLDHGADGIAAIRLFETSSDPRTVASALKALT